MRKVVSHFHQFLVILVIENTKINNCVKTIFFCYKKTDIKNIQALKYKKFNKQRKKNKTNLSIFRILWLKKNNIEKRKEKKPSKANEQHANIKKHFFFLLKIEIT